MAQVTMLKKLGAKQILGDIKNVAANYCAKDGDAVDAYSIFGTCNGIKTGASTYGEWTAFIGQMEAINHSTGEHFAAVQCFIPEPLQSIIKGALTVNDNVEFAFTVKVKRRDDLKEGYEYLVVPHKQATEADPLEKLRAMVPTVTLAKLAAPVAIGEQEAEAPAKGAKKK